MSKDGEPVTATAGPTALPSPNPGTWVPHTAGPRRLGPFLELDRGLWYHFRQIVAVRVGIPPDMTSERTLVALVSTLPSLFIGDFSQPTDEPARQVIFCRYRPEQVLAAVRDLWAAAVLGRPPRIVSRTLPLAPTGCQRVPAGASGCQRVSRS